MSTEPVEATATLSIDTGLPPVPFKLVKHIQAGEFPDVAELLPDRLGIRTESTDKDDKKLTLKKRQVTGILEWVPRYCIYTAVELAKYPEQNQDMLGYMALIMVWRPARSTKRTHGWGMTVGFARWWLRPPAQHGLRSNQPGGTWKYFEEVEIRIKCWAVICPSTLDFVWSFLKYKVMPNTKNKSISKMCL